MLVPVGLCTPTASVVMSTATGWAVSFEPAQTFKKQLNNSLGKREKNMEELLCLHCKNRVGKVLEIRSAH